MSSYLSCADSATLLSFDDVEDEVSAQVTAGSVGMIAVRAGEVADPGRAGAGALVIESSGPVRARIGRGEAVVFCHPVVTAPAVLRRDGTLQAGGWLPDFVRLGLLEQHLGEGVIEAVIAAAVKAGRVRKPKRRRAMPLELTARFLLAMVLAPDTDYRETMNALVGQLALVPWARRWQVPTGKVFTTWRRRLGEQVMRELFWLAAGSVLDPAGQAGTAALWCGRELCAIDGFQIDLPATDANRAEFGSSGTSDNSGPFPQARVVLVTGRAGRAVLGAAMDGCGVGEQTLITALVKERPEIFNGRVFLVDRNFLGHELITAILDAGGHLVMRVEQGIALPTVDWLADGSRMSYLNAKTGKSGDRLPVRVVEHIAVLPGTDQVSELYCLATTLLDHQAVPAEAIAAAYPQRWSASETTIGENKTTMTGAGPSTGPILRSGEPALVRQELWAWLTSTQLLRRAAAGAATSTRVSSGAERPDNPNIPKPIGTDQVSFTAVRREAIRSMLWTRVTATTSPAALAALADTASTAILTALVVTGRQRHSARRQKNRPGFPHTKTTTATVTGPVEITSFQPETTIDQQPKTPPPGR